ncbi:hypothetical protein [Siccirubricoccus sp. G192]|uniref:hypothetical protein n=1 Tax=Siccirubricoccus sp. G192 TaxID=2849651 RepID=UPI001C2BD0B9|nr:hypothetical protein [Siccirubricoccus sp. G192]MBV1797732.1 hypothetical protein [Siccirubricoccus sp. G192]
MRAWIEVKSSVPTALEIDQEDMLFEPAEIAAMISGYLGRADAAGALHAALTTHAMERTGAGIGRNRLRDTGWAPEELAAFTERCGPMMRAFGYEM